MDNPVATNHVLNGSMNVPELAGNTRNLSADAARLVVFVKHMELIGIPLIVTIGLTGNVLSAFIFLRQKLRKLSCSLYLAARAISDTGFLLCIFILWLQHLRIPLIHTQGVCQVEIFLSYLCGFLSVWFIVWVTVENYYRICHPFKVSAFCTVKKAMFMIMLTSLIGCMIYSFSTWTNGIIIKNQKSYCFMIQRFEIINTALTYVDCLITLAIPSAIILLITGRIIYSIMKTYRKRGADMRKGSGQLQTKVTRMLFWVSFTFLVLNIPSHIVRLRAVVELMTKQTTDSSPTIYLIQHILQMIYYLSFAVNFFIYISLGPSFRNTFLEIFCKPCLLNSKSKGCRMEMKTEGVSMENTAENLLSEEC